MDKQMSKGKVILFVIALFLTNVNIMNDMVIIPSIANIYETFGDQVNLVNYIVTGPQLVAVISALICGKLIQYFSKKTLIVVGFGLFTFGAIFGIAIESAPYMAVMRTIVGAAMGIVNVAAVALLAETFTDEKKRSTLLGLYNATMAGIGALMGLAAGFLAAMSWQSVYKVYWITVPILIFLIFFLPETPPEKSVVEKMDETAEVISLRRFLPFCLSLFFFVTNYMVLLYFVSVYVVEKSMGNEAVTGMLSSLQTVGSAIAGLLFGLIYSKLKRGSIIPSYLILTVGYFVLMTTSILRVAFVSCLLMGASFGNGFSHFYMRATLIVPHSKASKAIGIVTAVQGLGMFFSTYYVTILQRVLHTSTLVGIMPSLIVVCGVGSVLSTILTLRDKKNPAEHQINV